MGANKMSKFNEFISICEVLKSKEEITYGVNEIEDELLLLLNFVKKNKECWPEISKIFIETVKGIRLYPIEIVIFCMRELQWEEIKDTALFEKNNSSDWRVINTMNHILEVYERDWINADLYKYYSEK